MREYLKEEDIPQRFDGQLDGHLSLAPIRGFSGGNQSGKTAAACIEVFIQITGSVPFSLQGKYPSQRLESRRGPQVWRIVSIDFDNGINKNILPALRMWAPREFLLGGNFDKSYEAGKRTLNLYDKGQFCGAIELMSNKQEVEDFQGPPRNGILYDEEPQERIRKENLLRFTTTQVQEIYAMTPTNGMSWTFDKLAVAGQDDSGRKVDWFKFPSVANPLANLDSIREILKGLDTYDEIKMRLLGEYVSITGLVYGALFDPKVHVIEPFDTGCTCGSISRDHPDGCPYNDYLGFVGIDPHTVKPSVMTMCFIDREDNFIVDTCYKRGVDTEELKSDYHRLTNKKRIDWAVFDPSSDSSLTAFRGKNIFFDCTHGENRIRRAFKGEKYQGSIASGVDEVKKRLRHHPTSGKPRFYIMNRAENQGLIKSMKTLQRASWANEDIKGLKDRIAEGVHDEHAAMRYILQNRMRWKPSIDIQQSIPIPDKEMILV